MFKKQYIRRWATIFFLLSIVQITTLYGIDRFLQPTAVTAEQQDQEKAIPIPTEAIGPAYSPDKAHLAYTTADGRFIVIGKNGLVYSQQADRIPHFQWLANTSLLYFTQDESLRAYLLQVHGEGAEKTEPVMIQRWSGTKTKVEQVAFSPYLEYLYLMVSRNDQNLLYRYSFDEGIRRIPLGSLELKTFTYDDKTDTLQLYMEDGQVYTYEKRTLYSPEGEIVADSQPDSSSPVRPVNPSEPNAVGSK